MIEASVETVPKKSRWIELIQTTLLFLLIATLAQGLSLLERRASVLTLLATILLFIALVLATYGVSLRKRWGRNIAALVFLYWVGSRLFLAFLKYDTQLFDHILRDMLLLELIILSALLLLWIIVFAEAMWLLLSSKARSLFPNS